MANTKGSEPGAKKRLPKLNLLLWGLLLCTTGATGFFGWQYFSSRGATTAAAAPAEGANGEQSESEGGGAEQKDTGNAIVNFEPFLVNLADTEAYRYLRVTIRLVVTNKQKAEQIGTEEVSASKLRDAILAMLSSKSSKDIITPEGKAQLKGELKDKLNSLLPDGPVLDVLFTEFVVQL